MLTTLTCDEGKTYFAVTRKCTEDASEESYKILSGTTVLKVSPAFSDNEERTDEYCLDATANNQYVMKLIDSVGDSWSAGSWMSVAGEYGNIFFKNFLTDYNEETIALSMYYAIKKQQQWKRFATTGMITFAWRQFAFDDSSWTDYTPSSEALTATGTQYYRRHFTGLANMAAYEIRMNYMYGVVAYINGVEIFRDNMPSGAIGPVLPFTPCTGSYASYDFRGVIRAATDVNSNANNALAVELHYTALAEHEVRFDAFVAAVASSTSKDILKKCFIYPYPVSITSSTGTNPQKILDFNKEDGFEAAPSALPTEIAFEPSGIHSVINALRIWPYTDDTGAPGSFLFKGSMDSSYWVTLVSTSGATYSPLQYRLFEAPIGEADFKKYRLTINSASSSSSTMYAYEIQPVTCSLGVPESIEFNPSSYSVYVRYQELSINPSISEITNCTIVPALPSGLSFDSLSCAVSGKSLAALTRTTFTMTSVMETITIQGTFSLEVIECTGALTDIVRAYKMQAYKEAFSIKDVATQEVVLSVRYNMGQKDLTDWTTFLCLTGSKYEIEMQSTADYWYMQSFLYVNVLLYEDEYETVARMRYDFILGLPEVRTVNLEWSVVPYAQWFYKMNGVPANWFNGETTGWSTSSMGSFPAATNQIQLYKKTFNVASLTDVSGFAISLRYLYGCVIYLNGHEAFRNGVEGEVSTSSMGLNAYTDLMYRQITLPAKTMGTAETPAVNYLIEGTNTIAVAIVAQTASQTQSVFDCTLRLMGPADSRVFDYSVTFNRILGLPSLVADHYYDYSMFQSACYDNYWALAFKNDRREWISSVTLYLFYTQGDQHPKQFLLKARNNNLEEWTTLKNVTGMTWSLVGEHKRIWIENSKPWNQYRLENIATGDTSTCAWKLGAIDLASDFIPATIPELAYTTPLVISKGIEMGEVYPNSQYYYDFTVTPALPAGLVLDSDTGKISGTAIEVMSPTVYSIHAKRLDGGSQDTTLTLSVDICTGTKSLITLVARLDSWAIEGSYKLFAGKGTSGEVVSSNTGFRLPNGLNYVDFCVPHNVYTLELYDALQNGWSNPAGWYLTVDLGAMIFEMGQMPDGVPSVSTLFSSLLPFQVKYSDWKVWNSVESVTSGWKSVNFDDAAWETKKAAEFGNHVGTTAYVRHEVDIPAIEDYYVLNIRMKYAGGVVAYFNGRLVARFNLEENFDADTEATAVHDASAFSKFHIVLPTVGAVTGKNVIAFEIHRAAGESAVVFDATGVFGVNDCSPVVDSFSSIDSSEVTGCTSEDLLDLNPTTFGYIPNKTGSFLAWTVENLEGSKFNSFALQTSAVASMYGFSVYGKWESGETMRVLMVSLQSTKDRERCAWAMPVGIAGFSQFRFVVNAAASTVPRTNAYVMQYCKPSGSGSCPAIDDYPSVGEGEISPGSCPDGFRGYSYRNCTNGVLGDVQTDRCEYKVPAKISYANNNMVFVMGTEGSSGKPAYRNIIEEFYVQDSTPLPEGLKIDAATGEITGVPTATLDAKTFRVRGKNPAGETYVEITISVRKGFCVPEGVFPRTDVDEIAVYECSSQGNYVGTQRRACVLGKKDGEWQKASGFCMSVVSIVLIVLVVIAVIAVVVFLVVRSSRKAKAVGGVKGNATQKSAGKTVKSPVKV